jgi:hypothetical protein
MDNPVVIPSAFSAPVRAVALVVVVVAAFWSLGFRGGVETLIILAVVVAVDRLVVAPMLRRRQASRTG